MSPSLVSKIWRPHVFIKSEGYTVGKNRSTKINACQDKRFERKQYTDRDVYSYALCYGTKQHVYRAMKVIHDHSAAYVFDNLSLYFEEKS